MAILGYNTKASATGSLGAAGRMYVTSFVLASAQTLTELHGWFQGDGAASTTIRLVCYADSAGSPAARMAYTSPLTIPLPIADYELLQTGFSVALAAGTYWLGWRASSGNGFVFQENTGATHKGKLATAADPPDDPFGTTDTSGTRKFSVWAVVGAGGAVANSGFLNFA